MAMFNVGDWVYYTDDYYEDLEGALGFVLSVNYSRCSVHFIKDAKGKRIDIIKNINFEDLIPANSTQLDEQSFEVLMDLALATRDFEWCRELTEQYKRVAKTGAEQAM
jgi:hypothetical protein